MPEKIGRGGIKNAKRKKLVGFGKWVESTDDDSERRDKGTEGIQLAAMQDADGEVYPAMGNI